MKPHRAQRIEPAARAVVEAWAEAKIGDKEFYISNALDDLEEEVGD